MKTLLLMKRRKCALSLVAAVSLLLGCAASGATYATSPTEGANDALQEAAFPDVGLQEQVDAFDQTIDVTRIGDTVVGTVLDYDRSDGDASKGISTTYLVGAVNGLGVTDTFWALTA